MCRCVCGFVCVCESGCVCVACVSVLARVYACVGACV